MGCNCSTVMQIYVHYTLRAPWSTVGNSTGVGERCYLKTLECVVSTSGCNVMYVVPSVHLVSVDTFHWVNHDKFRNHYHLFEMHILHAS